MLILNNGQLTQPVASECSRRDTMTSIMLDRAIFLESTRRNNCLCTKEEEACSWSSAMGRRIAAGGDIDRLAGELTAEAKSKHRPCSRPYKLGLFAGMQGMLLHG